MLAIAAAFFAVVGLTAKAFLTGVFGVAAFLTAFLAAFAEAFFTGAALLGGVFLAAFVAEADFAALIAAQRFL